MRAVTLNSQMSDQRRSEIAESGSVTPISASRGTERGSRLKPFWKQAFEILQEIAFKDFQPKPVQEVEEEPKHIKGKNKAKSPKKHEKKVEKLPFGVNAFEKVTSLNIKELPPESDPVNLTAPFDPYNLDLVEN